MISPVKRALAEAIKAKRELPPPDAEMEIRPAISAPKELFLDNAFAESPLPPPDGKKEFADPVPRKKIPHEFLGPPR